MEGKRAITWLWDWLGVGSMGERYEVLPTVQPTVEVTPVDFPPQLKLYTNTVAIGVGNNIKTSPALAKNMSRLWFNLVSVRTSITAGDLLQLKRLLLNNAVALWQSESNLTPNPEFMVGGTRTSSATVNQHGRRPLLETELGPLQFTLVAAAAVGDWTVYGYYVDIPASSPIPLDFL